MAEYRTDLSRSIAGIGQPDSPQSALKKSGLFGANPAAVEPMFDGSAIMETLGYNNPNGKINIGIAGGSPGNRPQPIAGNTQTMVQRPPISPLNPTAAAPNQAGLATLQSVPAIAGVQSFKFNKRQPAGGIVANNSRSDWSPGSSNVQAIAGGVDKYGRTYDEQVAHAQQVNAANALPTMSPKQAAELAIANDPRRSAVTRANAGQGIAQFNNQLENSKVLLGNQQAQTIAGIKEQGDKYTADQHLAGVKYNADAHTKAAEIAGGAAVQKAQQLAQAKQQEQGQKDYTERVKSLVGDWSKLNLPKEYVPKLNEFAKIYTAAEDPASNTWLMPPNREGGMYAAMPRQYESVYAKLLQTMPHKDAAARIYQLAQQNGHVKDVPDFRRFLPTSDAIKNQNQTLIAGA